MKFEPKRLGRLEIDDEFELGGLDDWNVGGIVALENSAGIDAGLPVGVANAGPVAHQAPCGRRLARDINRRESILSRKGDDPFPMGIHECAASGEQPAGATLDD